MANDHWPNFSFDVSELHHLLNTFLKKTAYLNGLYTGLNRKLQTEAKVNLLVQEAIKTSEIEGAYLSRKDVRSSICKHLNLAHNTEHVKDHRAKGISSRMMKVHDGYNKRLSDVMLFSWHKDLFMNVRHIEIGKWRSHTEPMQIVSGNIDKPEVHFEAPPSARVSKEMNQFISWFNKDLEREEKKSYFAPVRSGLAHLYFESIHPFEDGNGRVGRALSEKALFQDLGGPILLSLSKAIEADKTLYYQQLKQAQRSNEITQWIEYFVLTLIKAQDYSRVLINLILKKAHFFDSYGDKLAERHKKVLNRMLEEEPEGFVGGITAKKYSFLTGVSKATATRDLQNLVAMGALLSSGKGRGVKYLVNLS